MPTHFLPGPHCRHAATQLTVSKHQKSCIKFKPARDVLKVDPGMGRGTLIKVARNMVMEDDIEVKHSQVMSSERQGEALHIAAEKQH